MGELRRQSKVREAILWNLPMAGNYYCPHNQRVKGEGVEPEVKEPGERWNHGADGVLPEILYRAERERRNILVFQLVTLQSLVIVSSVVHLNSKS